MALRHAQDRRGSSVCFLFFFSIFFSLSSVFLLFQRRTHFVVVVLVLPSLFTGLGLVISKRLVEAVSDPVTRHRGAP